MKLDGIHHITCITADAPGNVDFYARLLGMRFVKKTVNFDAPDVYHLYYGDERGSPGSILTFFEFPDAAPGRAGAGMIHRLRWRVASDDALAFWSDRLTSDGIDVAPVDGAIRFTDPEGLELEFAAIDTDDAPLTAHADDIPPAHAIQGFDGVRAYGPGREQEHTILTQAMGFTLDAPGEYRLQGRRTATYGYDDPPAAVGFQGAGTVHHIAWCDRDEEHAAWRGRLAAARERPTPVIERQYFQSI
jgi:glyoxalase family protein